jgi:ferritin
MAREDRVLSQSEIDSLLKKIAPKTDGPSAKSESAPTANAESAVKPVEPKVKPAELEVKPDEPEVETDEIEVKHAEPTVEPEETPAKIIQTVSFKKDESKESEKSVPPGLITDSMRMTERKPKAAETPAPAQPAEMARQKFSLDESDDLKKKVAELTGEVNKLSTVVQVVTQLEEKVKQLEVALKRVPESNESLKSRIDEIYAALEEGANKSDYAFLEAFVCSKCHSKGNVAIYTKCTRCGKENWMGWWPEEGKK